MRIPSDVSCVSLSNSLSLLLSVPLSHSHSSSPPSPFHCQVGHGTSENMRGVTPGKDEGGDLRVIVSRSHAGTVKETAQAAFDGRTVTVTPAGGLFPATRKPLIGFY